MRSGGFEHPTICRPSDSRRHQLSAIARRQLGSTATQVGAYLTDRRAMLQRPSVSVQACLDRAAECARMAELGAYSETRACWLPPEARWRLIAEQHQHVGASSFSGKTKRLASPEVSGAKSVAVRLLWRKLVREGVGLVDIRNGESGTEIIPKCYFEFGAGFFEAEKAVAAIPPHITARATADLASGHLAADVIF